MRRQLIIQLWIISRETYFYPQLCLSIIINLFPSTITSTYSYTYISIYIYIGISTISRWSQDVPHNPSSSPTFCSYPKHFPSELPQPVPVFWQRWNHAGTSGRWRSQQKDPPLRDVEQAMAPFAELGRLQAAAAAFWCVFKKQLFFWWEWHLGVLQ